MSTIYGAGGLIDGHIPLPTGTITHRTSERRNTSPWEPVPRRSDLTPAQIARRQKEAAETLRRLDRRSAGLTTDAYNARRRDQRTTSPNRGGRLDLDVNHIVHLYVEQRLTLKQVAAEIGASVKAVTSRLEEAGIPRRDVNAERRKITRDQLVAAVEAGRTPTQIADQYGMNPRHVNDLVRELRREAGLPIRRRAQPRVDAAPILAAATQGLTVTEIAQTTGISEVTVRRKLREAGVRARDGRRSA